MNLKKYLADISEIIDNNIKDNTYKTTICSVLYMYYFELSHIAVATELNNSRYKPKTKGFRSSFKALERITTSGEHIDWYLSRVKTLCFFSLLSGWKYQEQKGNIPKNENLEILFPLVSSDFIASKDIEIELPNLSIKWEKGKRIDMSDYDLLELFRYVLRLGENTITIVTANGKIGIGTTSIKVWEGTK